MHMCRCCAATFSSWKLCPTRAGQQRLKQGRRALLSGAGCRSVNRLHTQKQTECNMHKASAVCEATHVASKPGMLKQADRIHKQHTPVWQASSATSLLHCMTACSHRTAAAGARGGGTAACQNPRLSCSCASGHSLAMIRWPPTQNRWHCTFLLPPPGDSCNAAQKCIFK